MDGRLAEDPVREPIRPTDDVLIYPLGPTPVSIGNTGLEWGICSTIRSNRAIGSRLSARVFVRRVWGMVRGTYFPMQEIEKLYILL